MQEEAEGATECVSLARTTKHKPNPFGDSGMLDKDSQCILHVCLTCSATTPRDAINGKPSCQHGKASPGIRHQVLHLALKALAHRHAGMQLLYKLCDDFGAVHAATLKQRHCSTGA